MTKYKRNIVKGAIVSLAMLSGCDDGVNRDYTEQAAEERDKTSEQNRGHVQRNLYPNFRFQNEERKRRIFVSNYSNL